MNQKILSLIISLIVSTYTYADAKMSDCSQYFSGHSHAFQVLSPSIVKNLPGQFLAETIFASTEDDYWVLEEQNINRPTYSNLQITDVVVPEADSQFFHRLAIRHKLYSEESQAVFAKTSARGIKEISQKLLALTIDALSTEDGPYKKVTDKKGNVIGFEIRPTGEFIDIKNSKQHPLVTAGLYGGTDWIVLKKDKKTKRLVVVAGFVAAPYKYNLEDQLGYNLEEIHEGLNYKTKSADGKRTITIELSKMIPSLLRRLLVADSERVQALTRPAWFVTDNPTLSQHARDNELLFRDSDDKIDYNNAKDIGKSIFLRVEREVMFGLSSSKQLKNHPEDGDDFLVFGLYPYTFTLEQATEDPEVAAKLLEGLKADPDRAVDQEIVPKLKRYLKKRAKR